MRSVIGSIILLCLLSSCMGLSKGKIKALPDNTNILIISAVGNSLRMFDRGTQQIDTVNTDVWQLNAELENLIYDALKHTRFKLHKYHEYIDKKEIKLIPRKRIDKIDLANAKDHLAGFCIRNRIDRILIISEEDGEYHNYRLPGYGITRVKSLILKKTQGGYAYTCVEMALYDAKTMKKITSTMNYEVIGFEPDVIDNLYTKIDTRFFLSQKDLYIELFKETFNSIFVVSGLCEVECGSPEPFIYR